MFEFNFNFSKIMNKTKFYWLIQMFCWSIVTLLSIQHIEFTDFNQSTKTIYLILYFFTGLISSHFYKIIIGRFHPDDITHLQNALFPMVGALSIGSIYTVLDYQLYNYSDTSFEAFIVIFLKNVWKVLPWFMFFNLFRFLSIYQDRKQRESHTENLLRISKLESLKKQLNPHFLFNALNSIKALTLIDNVQARESIIQLSDLLRLSLNLGEQQKATLSEELRLAENYLSLEKLRFDTRLEYDFQIQDDIGNILIMPMTINTLLENAVKHGIGQLKSGGNIRVTANTEKGYIILSVENSGVFDPRPKSNEGGIGLENLKKRLELQYGDNASLKIMNAQGKVSAIIKMPY